MMISLLVAILCGLILMAGWFYLKQSRYVEELTAYESPRRNRMRRQARRLGALTMIVLSMSFFAGVWLLMSGQPSLALMLVWILVVLLLFVLILSVMVDIYLTARMRSSFKGQPRPDRNQHEDVDG